MTTLYAICLNDANPLQPKLYSDSYDSFGGNATYGAKNRLGQVCAGAGKRPATWKTMAAAVRKCEALKSKGDYQYGGAKVVEIGLTNEQLDQAMIAAAPQMLRALREALLFVPEGSSAEAAVRAAINVAEGRV